MTALRMLWYLLWIAPHVLQVMIVNLMYRRGLYKRFPAFFVYTIFEILQVGVLLAASQVKRGLYPTLYADGLAISTAIRFWVIYELYIYFFRHYPSLSISARTLFRATTVALLLLAVGLAIFAPSVGPDGPLRVAYTLDRTVSILQGGLLIVLFLFSKYFALSWRTHGFGIALGLGIFACVELATSAVWLQLGTMESHRILINVMGQAVYLGCVFIWLFYLARPETVPAADAKALPPQDLEIWNRELERLLHP